MGAMRSCGFGFSKWCAVGALAVLVGCSSEIGGSGDGADGGSDDGDDAGGGACEEGSPPPSSALVFDGEDDYVTMGLAADLGLTTFTVEAWVKRETGGSVMGTGVGGLKLVPIAGRGRGEKDNPINLNCNYAFGFNGGVLGADFEDDATGANHPVRGQTAVPFGEWHHVAATFDGKGWRLYLDGVLDGEAATDAVPAAESIQHFAIGTSMNSLGEPAGFFAGSIDEVRVWNRARSEAEIAASMYQRLESGDGLVGRWALDQGDGGAPDSIGAHPGTIAGDAVFGTGVVLDEGLPPVVSATGAAAGAAPVVTGGSTELAVDVADPDDDAFVASFHLREVTELDDFSIVVLPDTQYYSDPDTKHNGDPAYFSAQTQWVMDNREAYNIRGVIHNGDIVNNAPEPPQWARADAAMSILETPVDGMPDGMPYGVCPGNHDLDEFSNGDGGTSIFNTHFGADRFAGRGYYGGNHSGNNADNWVSFWAGGLQFVVVNFRYDTTPDPDVLAWARSVFEAHPNAFGIVNTHYIVNRNGNFGAQGQAIYDALKDVDNVQLMTNGHISAEARRTDEFEGNVIHSMLADYQATPFGGVEDGGWGFLRVWEFSPQSDELTVRSYSPVRDEWLTDEDSEFTLAVDLPGTGTEFGDVTTVDPAPAGAITATVDGLEPGKTYEWYATVSDCEHTVRTPVQRFTTE